MIIDNFNDMTDFMAVTDVQVSPYKLLSLLY